MSPGAMIFAIVKFVAWEAAVFGASISIALRFCGWGKDRSLAEYWLTVLAIEVTLESSIAALFSFTHTNSQIGYWLVAAAVSGLMWRRDSSLQRLALRARDSSRRFLDAIRTVFGRGFEVAPSPLASTRLGSTRFDWPTISASIIAALTAPLILLSFRPVEEIDSINYLHYLLEWLSNRATPYTFATNYVAFWELSFAPVWMVTRVDCFLPLLALKAVALMIFALWLVGCELRLPRYLLPWAIFAAVVMVYYWFGYSGVPTLKNDVLHGVGFVLLALVVLRSAQRALAEGEMMLLAFGVVFGAVKYTGIFVAVVAVVLVLRRFALRHPARSVAAAAVFFLCTSGHYYLHNFLLYGSPFYPFQINLGPIHLPGTADLSNTSILYSLRDPRLLRALFLPAGGVSPAGLLFPLTLAAILIFAGFRCLRRPLARFPLLLLAGWFLYFRSVFSASAYSGDLAFILNNLNSIRYVDGELAVSELFLLVPLSFSPWLAVPFVGLNLVSRLVILYAKLDTFTPLVVIVIASVVLALFLALGRRALVPAFAMLVLFTPLILERNHRQWTTYWDDLKPEIRAHAGPDLAELALTDGGYFAGHVVAAGSPMNPAVRSLLPEDIEALSNAARPRYLVVLVTPGSEAAATWESRYGATIAGWGYRKVTPGKYGALYEK